MSLIVAKKENNQLRIVSDTKLTYPSELNPEKKLASPEDGVLKSIIINEYICISFACNDISQVEEAIRNCRKLNNDVDAMLKHLLSVNIITTSETEFIICISLPFIQKIYEIKDNKIKETPYAWIGSKIGYEIFQEEVFVARKSFGTINNNGLSNLEIAMNEVIKSGKDMSVSGFNISILNENGFFEYKSYIGIEIPAFTTNQHFHYINHGSAEQGGYTVHVFPSKKNYSVVAIHILQGNFGVLYKIKDGGLLWPEVVSNINEHEFSKITQTNYGITPFGSTPPFGAGNTNG